jgi:type IV secretory pathway TraG/TraD family ATPase VirD4
MLSTKTDEEMSKLLLGTDAAKHFTKANSKTSASIMSVLMTNIKPLRFLAGKNEKKFSLIEYFESVKNGNNAWLFLSTKPSNRNLTLPLIACITELAMNQLLDIGIDPKRRVWFVIDELPSLGKIPILLSLMAEGRKYGACILAGLQSLNQLYAIYGQYNGSSIFGQFGTSFFFRNMEATITKMVSSICGMETVTRQQKNTSFGANEFRDGVSYSEHQQTKSLVDTEDLANLATGECYVLLPEPRVRISKMLVPEIKKENINPGFIERKDFCFSVPNYPLGRRNNPVGYRRD